jgi:hypothetical protein
MAALQQRVSRIVLFSVFLALTALPSASSADHSWSTYHWARTNDSFTVVQLGDNVSALWQSYLATASSDWSMSSVLDTVVVDGGTWPRNCQPTFGRVEVCSGRYGLNGWLGVAQVWISGDHITQATVKLNDTYFDTAQYNNPAWRNLVMCQEIGHTLGLDHQDEDFSNVPLGTCMDYSNDPKPNQHPNWHDYGELEIIYSHFDTANTLGASASNRMPRAMKEIDFATPAQWGRVIRRSHKGRKTIHELDFGRRHKVFTFVIWTRN